MHNGVFGAIERDSKECFVVPVVNRTKETLLTVIKERILIESGIISDGWPAYRELIAEPNYEYDFVIHSENFVSSSDPTVHTQNIENVWLHSKRLLRQQFGTNETLLRGYLFEFMFRKKFGKEMMFNELLFTIINYYWSFLCLINFLINFWGMQVIRDFRIYKGF